MSSYIKLEIILFLRMAGMGAMLLFIYRLLGILRWWSSGKKTLAVIDLLYWILAAGTFFFEIYRYNEGVLRIFLLSAVFLGAFFMNSLLKRLIFYVKRGKIFTISYMEKRHFSIKNRFCNLKRGKQIEKLQKKEKKHKNIK